VAQFPCSICGKRYKGAQNAAYPALIHSGTASRKYCRYCPSCWAVFREYVEYRLTPAEMEIDFAGCRQCGAEVATYAAFVTLYAADSDREDFWGRFCAGCAQREAAQALLGTELAL